MGASLADLLRAQRERNAALPARFFPPRPEPERPTRPAGDVDAGRGEGPDVQLEHVDTDAGRELMVVHDINNLDQNKETS